MQMQFPTDVAFGPFAHLYRWVTDNPIWLANSARLLDDLPAHALPAVIVDLGAGPGNSALALALRFPSAHIIALDLSLPMLLMAQQKRRAHGGARLAPLQADVFRLPLADASVDAVTGHSFLYLLPDVVQALAEVHRVLRPGGRVAFLEPQAVAPVWGWLWQQPSLPFILSIIMWRVYSRLHRRFHRGELAALLRQAGFQSVHTEVALGNFALFGRGQKPQSP